MDSCLLLSLEEKIAVWRNLSDGEIVKQIVDEYDLPIAADATPVTHQENDTTIMQRATDLQFVGELARRNGLEFFFETDKGSGKVSAYLRAPRLGGHPQPDLAIQFGEESTLVSFDARLTGQRPLTVKVTQTDVKSKSANTATADDTQLDKLGKQRPERPGRRPARQPGGLGTAPRHRPADQQRHRAAGDRAGGARRGGVDHRGRRGRSTATPTAQSCARGARSWSRGSASSSAAPTT